jgi:hypothetical protein
VFALAFAFVFVFVVPVLALVFVVVFVFAFALEFAFAFMFPLALLVFSAGEHAVHTLATARRVRSAKVLRIEFPPVPLCRGQFVGELRGPRARGSLERRRNSSGFRVLGHR